jgi:signal transduction histidine kinase
MSGDTAVREALTDDGRLEALKRTRLLDTPPEEAFDRLTRLVCRLLGAPVALVTLVEADRQFFKSVVGLPQPWSLLRQTSLLHSFCQHVVATGAPLLVQDARGHPLVADNLAVPDLGVVAYLGMPLATAEGHVLGSLCAIDTAPRSWTPGDAAALSDLAAVTMGEVTLRRMALDLEDRLREETAAREAAQARQAQARRLEALRELGSNVAHDFANVVQCVQSGVRLAEARLGRDPAIARHVLALVGDAARRGGSLSERFFAFVSRGELRAEPVDAAALLGRVGEALAQTLAAPLRIRVDAAPDLPPVLADPKELEAVLASLAATARDAMPEGGTLTLGAALDNVNPDAARCPGLRPGRYVRLFVADTGTGLGSGGATPADTEARDLAAKRANGATDLGLAMARELAEQAGGAVDLEARAGVGTAVTLRLPAA